MTPTTNKSAIKSQTLGRTERRMASGACFWTAMRVPPARRGKGRSRLKRFVSPSKHYSKPYFQACVAIVTARSGVRRRIDHKIVNSGAMPFFALRVPASTGFVVAHVPAWIPDTLRSLRSLTRSGMTEFHTDRRPALGIASGVRSSKSQAVGFSSATRTASHPLTAELTMESTKKRCRKTNRMSGGRTASVAPAMTRPVFIAPRL